MSLEISTTVRSRRKGKVLTCEIKSCQETFYAPRWKINAGFLVGVRFCKSECRDQSPDIKIIRKKNKYIFTPEIDEQIRAVYENNTDNKPRVRNLAGKLGFPRWSICKRAKEIGAYVPLKKEPVWSFAELSILNKYSHRHPSYILKQLSKVGFHRSEAAIILKRKRMRFIANQEGMSATMCAEFFGVDVHWVTRHIDEGLLKAEKRRTMRTARQGGDIFYIREKDIRKFIINNPEIIDLRKIEKFYFIELLANGGVN